MMSHVFHRNLRQPFPVAVAGDGPYLIDRDGRRYLDGSGGAAVSCLGHGHPAVVAAVREQVARLDYAIPRSSRANRPRRWPTT